MFNAGFFEIRDNLLMINSNLKLNNLLNKIFFIYYLLILYNIYEKLKEY